MRFFRFDPYSIRPREKCTVGALRAEAVGHDVSIVAEGPAGRARRTDDTGRVLADREPAPELDARSAQPRVLGRRRRQLPSRARRRTRAARRWRGARTAFPSRSCRSSVTCTGATCSSSGAARRSGRSPSPPTACEVVGLDVSHGPARARPPGRARRSRSCRRAANSCRSRTQRSTWCSATTARSASATPTISVPECARLLRPGGLLAFCCTHPLLYLTWDDAREQQTRKLQIDYAELGRMPLAEGTIDWVLPPGEWIRVLRGERLRGRGSRRAVRGPRRDHDLRRLRPAEMGAALARRMDLAGPPCLTDDQRVLERFEEPRRAGLGVHAEHDERRARRDDQQSAR